MATLDLQPELDLQPDDGESLDLQPELKSGGQETNFEDLPVTERALKGPTAALETAVRGPLSFIAGTLGKTAGTAVGALQTGSVEGAVKKGQEYEHALQIPAFQKGSEYFDEEIGKGLEWLRNKASDLGDEGGTLDQKSYEDLRREAARRSISEGLFDELMASLIRGKGRQAKEVPKQEEPIKRGPAGEQLDLIPEEGPLNPPSMMEQENRSPYNLPKDEVERLERELNPPTEQRVEPQGELFTDYNPVDKLKLEESQGGGRFRTPNMDEQVTSSMNREGLGGATEQSNFTADLYKRDLPRNPDEPIPYEKPLGQTKFGRKQGGAVNPDLLTLGVSKLLETQGWKDVMEKFRGTFSDKAIDKAIRESKDPNSKSTIVFMTPDKFHELAMKRAEGSSFTERENAKAYKERVKEPIKEALKTKEGLSDIPELWLSSERGAQPGAPIHSVWAHEGRHRADVFKEQGLDLMPVKVIHNDVTWGAASGVGELPRKVISENGKFTDFPQPANWRPEQDLDFTNKGKFGQGGAINPKLFQKEVDKKGLTKTLIDARKQFQMDRRPLSEVIEGITPDSIKDISLGFKMATNALIDRSASILSETKGGVGKIIKWTVDQISEIDRKSNLAVEKDLFGEKYKAGSGNIFRPLETRVRGEEGLLTKWKDAHKTSQGRSELRSMLDTAIERIGQYSIRDHFKTDKQWEVYQSIQNGFKNILDRVNTARESSGMKPIQRLDGFLPAAWEGDYRVHVFDGMGNKKASFGFSNVYEAKLARRALVKEHPDLQVRDPEHITKDKTQIGDLSAFEEAIRTLGKDDPITKALQQTMVQLRSSKGFGRHGLQRKGVLGFLGMEAGDLGVRNMERSIEQYTRQANRYISNMEKAKVASQLDSIPLELQKKIPQTFDYLRDYIDNSRGKSIDRLQLVSDMAGSTSRLLGMGESGPQKLIKQGSSLASLYFLTTPRFFLSQMTQHLNALPKYVQMSGQDNFANPGVALWKGWEHFISPDQAAKDGANWAQRNGHLDSALVAMLEMKMGDVAFERSKLIKDVVSVTFGQLEKKMVRLPTFLAMEYGLRESIKDPKLRYETAANMMDHYMVHYGATSSPLMYSKAGLVGDAARTFKQYSHNGWGQFFEYLSYANKESIAPLLTHIGVQTLVGGLKGTVLVAEAAAAIAVVNVLLSAFDVQIPDPQDALMNSNLHDLLVFGGLSTVLGSDISSSVNAPNVPQMFSAPSVELPFKAIRDGGSYLMKKLAGVDTEQDQLKAALSLAPSAMRGYIEELFSRPGEPVPKASQKMKGNYVRDEIEKTMAKYFSVKSLPEARINGMVNAAKKELVQDMNAKTSALDAIVDRIETGQELNDKVLQRYIDNGGDPKRLMQSVKQRMIERTMDFADRQIYNKSLTPQQIHKLDVMKSLLDREYSNSKDAQAKKMGLFDSEVISQPKEGTVSDSFPRSDVHGMNAQSARAHQQFRTETRQLSRRNKVTEEEALQSDFGDRSRTREEMNQLRKMEMKNKLLTM